MGRSEFFEKTRGLELSVPQLFRQHMIYTKLLAGEGDSTEHPTKPELDIVLSSLTGSRAVVVEEGVILARKGEEEKKVMLLLEPSEVERVLGDVGGERWKSALGAGL